MVSVINQCYSNACCATDGEPEKGPSLARQIGILRAHDEEEVGGGDSWLSHSEWLRWSSVGSAAEPSQAEKGEIEEQKSESPRLLQSALQILEDPSRTLTLAEKRLHLVWELQRAQHEAAYRTSIIRGPTLTVGSLLIAVTVFSFMILRPTSPSDFGTANGLGNFAAVFSLGLAFGWMLLLLAILPSDKQIVASACWLQMIVIAPMAAVLAYLGMSQVLVSLDGDCSFQGMEVFCHSIALEGLADCAASFCTTCCMAYMLYQRLRLRQQGPLVLLSSACRATGLVWMNVGLFSFALKHAVWFEGGCPGGLVLHTVGLATGVLLLLLGLVFQRPQTRRWMQLWLGSFPGTVGAGVAALLGSRTIEEVMAVAQSNLRSISCERVKFSDYSSKPTKDQRASNYALTEPAEFGKVDAFISCSPDDNPSLKWDALQAWRSEFKQLYRREPKIWLDQFCVSPGLDIDVSLAVLPVYIAACKRMLSFCSPRYLTCLRSVVEIFSFAEVGKTVEDLDLRVLEGEVPDLKLAVESLNVWQTSCDDRLEHQQLELVLEAGYSGSQGLESIVKTVLYVGLNRLSSDANMDLNST